MIFDTRLISEIIPYLVGPVSGLAGAWVGIAVLSMVLMKKDKQLFETADKKNQQIIDMLQKQVDTISACQRDCIKENHMLHEQVIKLTNKIAELQIEMTSVLQKAG